jgi:hypothetical protein
MRDKEESLSVPRKPLEAKSPSCGEFHNVGIMNYVVNVVVTDDTNPVKHMLPTAHHKD